MTTIVRAASGGEALIRLFGTLQERLPDDRYRPWSEVSWPWPDGLGFVHHGSQDAFGIYLHARRLLTTSERLVHRREKPPRFDVNVGIAVYPDDGNNVSSLLNCAYSACEACRSHWKESGFCFFSRSMGKEVADRLTMDVCLLRAFKADLVELQFQPILDLRHSLIIGAFGMPVWHHATLGLQTPDVIMETVERARIANVYNAWLVDRICGRRRQWCETHGRRRIGIKVSRPQLVDASLTTQLSEVLSKHRNLADRIEVAIDGTLIADGTDHRLRTGLRQLADLGVRLTVANIGLQPLPLEALKMLPFQTMELAPEMVSPIGRCKVSDRTLAALVGMMSNLGLNARATGVRSKEQLDFLIANDCDEVTGPLLGAPVRADEFDGMTNIPPCIQLSNSQDLSEQQRRQMG